MGEYSLHFRFSNSKPLSVSNPKFPTLFSSILSIEFTMTHSLNEFENIYSPNEYENDHGDDLEEEIADASQAGPSQASATQLVDPSQASSSKSKVDKAEKKLSRVGEHFNSVVNKITKKSRAQCNVALPF